MQSLQGREGPVLTAQGGTTGLAALEAECGTWMGGGCTKPLRLPLCTSNLQKVERKAESERGQNALVHGKVSNMTQPLKRMHLNQF